LFGDIKLTNKPAIKEMERISDKEIAKLININIISLFLSFNKDIATLIDLIIKNLNTSDV
jgi:hypothetical protein